MKDIIVDQISTLGRGFSDATKALHEVIATCAGLTGMDQRPLSVLQGEYAPDLKTFWIIAHSLHEMTFIAAIGFCWQLTAVRNTF